MLQSPLARQLTALLFLLAALEIAFVLILAFDVLGADKLAQREFQLFELSQEVSNTLYKGKELRRIGNGFWFGDEYPGKLKCAFEKSFASAMSHLLGLKKRYQSLGINPGHLDKSINGLEDVNKASKEIFARQDRSEKEKEAYEKIWFALFRNCFDDIVYLHSLLPAVHAQKLALGLSPDKLLLVFVLANAAFLAVIFVFLDRRVSGPILSLTKECGLIAQGLPISRPKKVDDEVSDLHESFYFMSCQIAENEKRRKSFLEFFHSMQTKTINSARKLLEPLIQQEGLADKTKDRCRGILHTLERLLALLDSLAQTLKSASPQKLKLKGSKIDATQICDSALKSVEPLLAEKQIVARAEFEQNEISLQADEDLLLRVLINLLSNAIKYSPENSNIIVCARQENNSIFFSVKDQGPGLNESEQKKLFKQFSQVESADGIKREGTGLGLAICKQIIEAHKGEIGCHSVAHQGSTFFFRVPQEAVRELKVGPQPTQNNADATLPELGKNGSGTDNIKRKNSIKTRLILILSVFILVQFGLTLGLYLRFSEASKRKADYAAKKEIFLHTQKYLGMFLIWTRKLEQSVRQMSEDASPIEILNTASPLLQPLKERIKQAKWICLHANPGSQLESEMRAIAQRDTNVLELVQLGLRSGSDMSPAFLEDLRARITSNLEHTDSRIFDVFDLERQDMRSAYELSLALRKEIAFTLGLVAFLNILLIGVSLLFGLELVKAISLLKNKAGRFAAGEAPVPSLKGDDELAFLDLRLCQVSAEIKEAEHTKGRLLAVISHDMATPLSSVLSGLDVLSAGLYQELGEDAMLRLDECRSTLEKVLRQIQDLLLIEKIDAGNLVLKPEPLNLNLLMQEAFARLSAEAEKKDLDFEVKCTDSTSTLVNTFVLGNLNLSGKTLEILLANAIQASPSGSEITISGSHSGDKYLLQIKNQSEKKIADDLKPQLFDRFRHISGQAVPGLGLPLAHRLSQKTGSKIELEFKSNECQANLFLPVYIDTNISENCQTN